MTDRERLTLISEVYGAVLTQTVTFHGRVGGDLAYLLGAISDTSMNKKCLFSPLSGIVKMLTEHFASDHKVWSFIEFS